MLNLNNANVSDAPQMERTLIPAGTVCRAVVNVKLGDMEIPEFGTGQWFKKSQTSKQNGWSWSLPSLAVSMTNVSSGTKSLSMAIR
jgi:hypothetical protein